MSAVWKCQSLTGSAKLVMLAMADWCNDQGGSLYPSNDAVALKCSLSHSQAVRVLRDLCEAGWLSVIGNHSGGAPGTTKQFSVNVKKLSVTGSTNATPVPINTGSTHATGSADATGSIQAARRVAPRPPTGSTHATQSTSEPSSKPKEKEKAAPSAFIPPDWIDRNHWDAWHSCLKRKKATDSQKRLSVEKLAKWRAEGKDHAGALEASAIGGWSGLFLPDGNARAGPIKTRADERAHVVEVLTGRKPNESPNRNSERDITGECSRIP